MSDYLPFSRPFDANGWEESGYLQCRSLEEARAVAAYLDRSWLSHPPEEYETARLCEEFARVDILKIEDWLSKTGCTRDAPLPPWRRTR